jgi:hypothetical protein
MFLKLFFGFALGCSALLSAGCGGREPQGKPPPKDGGASTEKKENTAGKKESPAGPQTVTLHVPEMKMRGGNEGTELT